MLTSRVGPVSFTSTSSAAIVAASISGSRPSKNGVRGTPIFKLLTPRPIAACRSSRSARMLTGSSGSKPASAVMTIAQSATLRASGPTWSCISDSGMMLRMLASPCVALSPAIPQHAAG
jgi:hypothetical protein